MAASRLRVSGKCGADNPGGVKVRVTCVPTLLDDAVTLTYGTTRAKDRLKYFRGYVKEAHGTCVIMNKYLIKWLEKRIKGEEEELATWEADKKAADKKAADRLH